MANVIQFLKGLAAARTGKTPASAEPLWVTDDKLLYMGDGTTAGGVRVSTYGWDWKAGTEAGFHCLGIDDNAPARRLLVEGSVAKLGSSTGTYALHGDNTSGLIIYGGGSTSTLGSLWTLYSEAHATNANDAEFSANSAIELSYSDTASSWDFEANLITTTGAIVGASYGGVLHANIVDKIAAETISGVWDFTANSTALTQTAGNNTTRLATTAFVTTAVAGAGGGGITWVYKIASYTAVAGDGILCNITSGTITLPATLAVGDALIISNTNSTVLTIADAGHTIEYKGTSYAANITLAQGETVHLVAKTTAIMEIV